MDLETSVYSINLRFKVILSAIEPVAYQRVTVANLGSDQDLIEFEKWHFGFDHAEAGARLLAHWNIPSSIVISVHHHHNLSTARSFARLAAIVCFANRLARHLETGSKADAQSLEANSSDLDYLRLTPGQVSALLDEARSACTDALKSLENLASH